MPNCISLKTLFFIALMSTRAFASDTKSESSANLQDRISEILIHYQALVSEDLIKNNVFEALRGIEIMQIINAPRISTITMINDHQFKFSIYTQVNMLERFEREFPTLYAKFNYKELLDRLHSVINEYGLSYEAPLASENYEMRRPLEGFLGNRLVLGCGRNSTSCAGHTDRDYLLDIASEAGPDLTANYDSFEFWKEFADETFEEVFFEGFLPGPNTHSLQQLARILKPQGIVRMGYSDPNLGILKFVRETDENVFNEYIKNCGFSKFEIRDETFRSNGQESEGDMLILIK